MTTLTASGLRVSSTHTPQAEDDYYVVFDNVVSSFNVLANDSGGSATSLFSVDQSFSLTPQLSSASALGAAISISNGMVVYDPTHTLAIDSLLVGQQVQDTFIYWDRLGNGTLSSATVHVTVNGMAKPLHGAVEDGYISGATVYIDANGNGAYDPGIDPSAITDANGNFNLTTSVQGPLIAFGGTNIDTGLANTLTFTAPEGSTVINPVTTIIESLVAGGMTIDAAQQVLLTNLSLPATVNLLTLDPLATPNDTNSIAEQLWIAQIDTLLANGLKAGANEGQMVDAIASLLTSQPSPNPTLLTATGTIQTIFSNAGATSDLFQLAQATATENNIISQATTIAGVTAAESSFSGSNPNVIVAGVGQHTINASGTMTIYCSDQADVINLAPGGNYTIWNANESTFFNLGQINCALNQSGNDPYTRISNMFDPQYCIHGVDANGNEYWEVHLNSLNPLPGVPDTVVTFMGSNGFAYNDYGGTPFQGDQIFGTPEQWAYDSQWAQTTSFFPGYSTTLHVTDSNDLYSAQPVPTTYFVNGTNDGFDLSAGGADVLHIGGGTGTTTVWGFDPTHGDILDVSGTAAGSGGWTQFQSAVQSTGHEGHDALGNEYYEFNLGNADIVLMGVTASQFSQLEANHSTFGF